MTILALGLPHGMDYLWIFIVFLLMFGANKLPQLARGLGRSLGEFKKAKQEFDAELQSSIAEHPPAPANLPSSAIQPALPSAAPVPGTVANSAVVAHTVPPSALHQSSVYNSPNPAPSHPINPPAAGS